jgi:putative phosphoesterase
MVILGIISDTHVPDRARQVNPAAIEIFRHAGVDFILHAGDICTLSVISQLEELAPVYAVRGNRDWPALRSVPKIQALEFEGVKVGLLHGHGSLVRYVQDKGSSLLLGLRPGRYLRRALAAFPEARVVVYGHTHIPVNRWVGKQLCFNPGSACCPDRHAPTPSVGLIRIYEGGQVEGEIIPFNSQQGNK